MDIRYQNSYGRILSWPVLCFAVAVAACGGVLQAEDSFIANAPQGDRVFLSPLATKPFQSPPYGLSDQSSLEDEISEKKQMPSGSLENQEGELVVDVSPKIDIRSREIGDKWGGRTLARTKHSVASGNSLQSGKTEKSSGAISVWRSMLSLIVVLGLILGISYVFKRFMPSANRISKDSGLDVLARCGIGPKQSLCLVKMGPRLILIGQSPNHMAALDVVDSAEDVAVILGRVETASPESISNSFGKQFREESDEFTEKPSESPELYGGEDLAEVRQIHLARRELSSLLDKVKGLARLKDRF